MTADSRRTITAALEAAGWTDQDPAPGLLPKLRHSSGPVLTVVTDNGGCALELGDGLSMTFLSGLPTAVVIAACLAASGQLDPSQERVELEERDGLPPRHQQPSVGFVEGVAERSVADIAAPQEQKLSLGRRAALRRVGDITPQMHPLESALDP